MNERYTSETGAVANKLMCNVSADFARKLKYERDEAVEKINSIRMTLSKNGEAMGNGTRDFSIMEMVENLIKSRGYFIQKSDSLERERDEAREESLEQARLLGISGERECRLIAERDEEKKKYDIEATEHMLNMNKCCNQRDEAMDVLSNLSHYLSCGLGDENTTAKEYGARIREGINALLDPILEEKETLRKMLDLQTKIVVDLEMRLMK